MRASKIRGRRANLLFLAQGRSQGYLLHRGFRDRATTIRVKAKVSHPKIGDISRLLACSGRERVSIPTSLDIGNRIVLRGRDPRVMGSGLFADSVYSSLPYHRPREPLSVSGCCTGPYYFTIRSNGPGYGSRSRLRPRPRLTG